MKTLDTLQLNQVDRPIFGRIRRTREDLLIVHVCDDEKFLNNINITSLRGTRANFLKVECNVFKKTQAEFRKKFLF